MAFGWGTDNTDIRATSLETLSERYKSANINTRYYNPYIHKASFGLPQYMMNAIEKELP